MNIVIVNHYAGGPSLGMEFRPYYLAREWTKSGHNVLIIGASYSHVRTRQPQLKSTIQKEEIDGVDYLWIKVNRYAGNGIGRIISMFLFSSRLYTKLKTELTSFKPDLIIASSTYPIDNFPVARLAKKYGALHCYEVHDLWPLSPMELGRYSKNHPFIKVMQWAEDFAYKNADFVVSMLPNTLEHMTAHGLSSEKFNFVPNGIAVDEWKDEDPIPEQHATLLQKLHTDQRCIVGYVGGHAISNALETFLCAAQIAENKAPHLAFVLVGNGAEKEKLIQMAASLGLKNISFLPAISKNSIPRLLSELDILYLGWHDNPLYRFGISPNKLIDYMMAGKPVVHSVKAANDMVNESSCGISVAPGDADAIVDALLKIAEMPLNERQAMGLRGQRFILENNDYRILADKFLNFTKQKDHHKHLKK
jgi:glycosyltransferase involved in cell wall biosynthesis